MTPWPVHAAGSRQREIGIPTLFERAARAPMWVAGASVCLLAMTGLIAVVRSIPASYASIPGGGAGSPDRSAPSDLEIADADDPPARVPLTESRLDRRNRPSCSECGVVKSMRQIEDAGTGKRYEITVRFRDGSTTVFNEAGPGTWRVNARVIVIGRSTAPEG